MRKLNEIVTLRRRATTRSRHTAATPEVVRRIWCQLESSGDAGILVICRGSDVADISPDLMSVNVRDSRWLVELRGQVYRVESWQLIDETESPRRYVGLKIGLERAGGNSAPSESYS